MSRQLMATAGALTIIIIGSNANAQTWDDVLPRVRIHCAQEFPDDYSTQAYCIKQQHDGWNEVHGDEDAGKVTVPHSSTPPIAARSAATDSLLDATAESNLVAIVQKYTKLYSSASNDMVKGGLRPERGREICNTLKGTQFSNWVGTVYSLGSNADGNGTVELDVGGGVYVQTWNTSFADIGYHTLIPHNSPLFSDAAALRKGQKIEFSGTLFSDNLDCFRETSLTVDGAMREPEFLIRLSSVKHEDVQTPPLGAPQTQGIPAASAAATSLSPPSQAYIEGRNARIAYENWFAGLSDADKAGAEFWASRRSLKPPPSTCHYQSTAFENGCQEAKRILKPLDARRTSEPDFKLGWNSL